MPYQSLLYASYYGYFVVGFILTVVGPIIPVMREDFALSLSEMAPLFLVQGAGFSLAVLVGGIAADRYGRRPILIAGAVMLAAGFMAFALAPGWSAALVLFFFSWAGFGVLEGALNSLAVDLSEGNSGRSLNVLHFFPALGAVVGPFLGDFLTNTWGWRSPLVAMGILYTVFLIWILRAQFPAYERRTQAENGSITRIAANPILIFSALALLLYVGAENSVSGWSVSYVTINLAASPFFGAAVTSLLWFGLLVGRIVCVRLHDRLSHLKLLLLLGSAATIAYVPVLLTRSPGAVALFTFVTGVSMGGFFPTLIGFTGELFPRRIGSVMGFMIASSSIGGSAVPALVGVASDRFGMQMGLGLIVLASAAMVLSVLVVRHLHARRSSPPPADNPLEPSSLDGAPPVLDVL